jgi:hypothetical protein
MILMMKKFFYLAFTFLFFSSISAIEVEDFQQMRLAKEYFHVKNYSAARDIYQALLQQNLPSWARAVVMFNLGCTQLADKNWDQASKAFSAISLDNPLKPLLDYQIKRNRMLMHIRQAETLNDFSSIQLLQNAIEDTAPAQKAYCTLQLAEGYANCGESVDILTLKRITFQNLAKLQQTLHAEKARGSLKEGLPLLLASIDEAKVNGEFLKKKFPTQLKTKYQNLFTAENQKWITLWNALNSHIKNNKNDPEIKKRQELFNTAWKNYKDGLAKVESNQSSEASLSFETSSKAIQALIEMPPPPSAGESPKKSESQAPMKNQPAQQFDKVLQLLLEMEQADEPTQSSQPPLKKVEHPW